MPAYRVRVIVLRKTKLGETDTILTLLASDGRQVRAVAKGMRKPGSRLSGKLEPFFEADLLVHTGRTLDVISEVEVVDAHAALRQDYDRTMAASVVADVLDKVSVEVQAEERLFGLAGATLAAMEAAEPESLHRLVTALLVKAMAMHGLRPELESCAGCAASITGGTAFSLAAGGVICPACGDASTVPFTDEARVFLLRVLHSTMEQVAAMQSDPVAERQAFDLMRQFVRFHLPARLRALDMYAGSVDV